MCPHALFSQAQSHIQNGTELLYIVVQLMEMMDDGKSVLGTMSKFCTTNQLLKNKLILLLLSW